MVVGMYVNSMLYTHRGVNSVTPCSTFFFVFTAITHASFSTSSILAWKYTMSLSSPKLIVG